MRQDRIHNAMPLLAALLLAAPLAASPPRQDDTSIPERVDAAILHSPLYGPFDLISYEVTGGTVTLGGEVYEPTLRKQTEKAVASIPGVTRVVNSIGILPASFEDDRLRHAVFGTIYSDSRLAIYGTPLSSFGTVAWGRSRVSRGFGRDLWLGREPLGNYSIHVVVNRGRVTLYGLVDNEVDRNRAALDAQRVFGVMGVENRIEVIRKTPVA